MTGRVLPPFQKAIRLQLAAAAFAVVGLAVVAAALAVGRQNIAVAVALGFVVPIFILVGLLPAGIGCPKCGHSIILPAESPLERPWTLKLHFFAPSRRCRKCGNCLDRSN